MSNTLRAEPTVYLLVALGFFTAADAAQPVSFATQIAPILARRCLACHSARVAKGRVDLENHAAVMRDGINGATVAPGDADLSLLYLAVLDGSMPKGTDALGPHEIDLIKTWINQGARLDSGVDPEAGLWNIVPREPNPPPPQRYRLPLPVTALAFSPDGTILASSGYHEVLLWDARDGRLLRRIADVAQRTYAIDFSPDGHTIAVACGSRGRLGEAKVFDVANGKLVRTYVSAPGTMFAAEFSPNGKRLAVAGTDRIIRVFDATDGSQLFHMADHHKKVLDLAWSPDGTRLVSAAHDRNAKVFDMQTGQQLATYNKSFESQFAGLIYGVAFTHDGRSVVSCGNDNKVRIWKADDAKLIRRIDSHQDTVFRVAVTKDGRVVSCSADRTVRLHALESGELLRTFDDHRECVYAVALITDDTILASGSYDGEIRIRELASGELVTAFTAIP